jgi:hypothetical protein
MRAKRNVLPFPARRRRPPRSPGLVALEVLREAILEQDAKRRHLGTQLETRVAALRTTLEQQTSLQRRLARMALQAEDIIRLNGDFLKGLKRGS